jgi:membrane associated rhomboid family serine protease
VETEALRTCYRHPDRETRLSCSNCGRPICIDCLHTADVGQRCPECVAATPRPRTITMADVQRRSTRGSPVSFVIIAACVVLFVYAWVLPVPQTEAFYFRWKQDNTLVAAGQWWRIITGAFLHDPSGFAHILFNMWALYLFGPRLERDVGSPAFAAMYLASAVGGGLLFLLLRPDGDAVGASGAIFGVFGVYLVGAYRSRHTALGRASLRQLMVLLGINLALPLFLPIIAWEAHVGGLLAGMAIATLWSLPAVARSLRLRTVAGLAVLAVGFTMVLTLPG